MGRFAVDNQQLVVGLLVNKIEVYLLASSSHFVYVHMYTNNYITPPVACNVFL